MSLNITLYTPTRILCNTVTDEVVIPTEKGYFAIREHHQKHCAAISTGLLRVKTNNSWILILVLEGFLRIEKDSLNIFVKDAQIIRSVDSSDIYAKLLKAKEEIKNLPYQDRLEATAEIAKLKGLILASRYL